MIKLDFLTGGRKVCIGNDSSYSCSSILEIIGDVGENPFITITRHNSTYNMGLALGQKGGMDLWDCPMVPLNSDDLKCTNIATATDVWRVNATTGNVKFAKNITAINFGTVNGNGWTGSYNATKSSDGSVCRVYVSGGIINSSTNC